MSDPELKLDIPLSDIKNAIAVAVLSAFDQEKRDQMLKDVVRAHLTAKKDNWSKETILEETIGSQLKAMALEAVKLKIETWRPHFIKEIGKTLEPCKDSLFDKFKEAVARVSVSSVSVTVELED